MARPIGEPSSPPRGAGGDTVTTSDTGRRPDQSADQRSPDPSAARAEGPSADELLELLRRERADFLNYRRRIADERAADAERIRAETLEPLLPLLDDLERAAAEMPNALRSDPWAQGVALIRSRLRTMLAGLGLEPLGEPDDPFDPTRHDALFFEPDPTADEQRVAAVIRPGYQLGGRLLRPAQVSVSGPPPETPREPPLSERKDDSRASPAGSKPRREGDPHAGQSGGG
jgi:molecular chaperone GrpE